MSAKDTNVGKDTEQRVARWLRDNGHPHAERTVRTGYRTADRQLVDAGDIDGTPGLVWQVKSMRPATRAETSVASWMAELEEQRAAVDADLGLLVVRRWGTTDVGRWWAFLPAADLLSQAGGLVAAFGAAVDDEIVPVRMEMRHAVTLLAAWGYGGDVVDGAA